MGAPPLTRAPAGARAALLGAALLASTRGASAAFVLLDPTDYRDNFIERGNPCPQECGVVNESTYEWAVDNLPLFASGDADLTEAYYYRVKSFRSHMMRTAYVDAPWVFSEFGPEVPWGGAYGTINAAAGHVIHEGRWIADQTVMDGEIRFWFGGHHFANGTSGPGGNDAYSSWIIMSALARARVLGSTALLEELLPQMAAWWEGKARYGRQDCAMDPKGFPSCLDTPPSESKWPQCFGILDGWDAMEGSVSGAGCRPTVNAQMYAEAVAIADIADLSGNATLAATFQQRAEWLRETYIRLLWNPSAEFFGVYKVNLRNNPKWACNCTGNPTCHQAPPAASTGSTAGGGEAISGSAGSRDGTYGKPDADAYADTTSSAASSDAAHDNRTNSSSSSSSTDGGWRLSDRAALAASTRDAPAPLAKNLPGCPPLWPCNVTVTVRELLGLSSPWYYSVLPFGNGSHGGFDAHTWPQLFDKDGFWAEWGPTTVERRHRCFNQSQDEAECNWAGPSWPYETSRTLTALSNYLRSPASGRSGAAAALTASDYVRLLRVYARGHTRSMAVNGSQPWVGENIEPDKGYWIARDVMYRGGQNPTPVNCTACRADPRPRNCGGWQTVPACCSAAPSCDGKVIPTQDKDRGKDYNHSTFLDLIIAGLVGLRASFGDWLVVEPLADETVGWFALDNVTVHGRSVTVAWDGNGSRAFPGCAAGQLCVWVDGRLAARSSGLGAVNVSLA